MTIASIILIVSSGLLACLVIFFAMEICAAVISRPSEQTSAVGSRCTAVVLIPAHNESHGIAATLTALKPQLRSGDRLLVVADNCTDDTASIAANIGAEVIERSDLARQGKGYALEFGLEHLRTRPPDSVIFIDADCRLSDGALDIMAQTCMASGRPVQILDLMTAPENSPINYHVAEFAWRVRNEVRPLGLAALNGPCPLMGTGMAFPWLVIGSTSFASSALTEDRQLGLALAEVRKAPLFCPAACVTSHFAGSAKGAATQRRRWEEGNIHMILREAPSYFVRAVATGNIPLLALALDSMVPPLSLLALLTGAMFLITGAAALAGASPVAFTISSVALVGLIAAVLLAWLKYGRHVLPVRALPLIAAYVLGKLPLYRQIFSGRKASTWVRTDREKG